ncbi:hypothetical protein BDD12DRAFT_876103 [Trichophaea hybrida]|nr:hypothetical protein BDD12DRAFT_876103 [Trichophaea hybrida]
MAMKRHVPFILELYASIVENLDYIKTAANFSDDYIPSVTNRELPHQNCPQQNQNFHTSQVELLPPRNDNSTPTVWGGAPSRNHPVLDSVEELPTTESNNIAQAPRFVYSQSNDYYDWRSSASRTDLENPRHHTPTSDRPSKTPLDTRSDNDNEDSHSLIPNSTEGQPLQLSPEQSEQQYSASDNPAKTPSIICSSNDDQEPYSPILDSAEENPLQQLPTSDIPAQTFQNDKSNSCNQLHSSVTDTAKEQHQQQIITYINDTGIHAQTSTDDGGIIDNYDALCTGSDFFGGSGTPAPSIHICLTDS